MWEERRVKAREEMTQKEEPQRNGKRGSLDRRHDLQLRTSGRRRAADDATR